MKLNLGCGNDYRQGWVNVDVGNCRKDLHHDLEKLPLPFADNTFDEVLMMHVLEHVDRTTFPAFMRELHRVCRPSARIHIEVPYYNSKNAWTDFTHKNFFTEDSFGYFDRTSHLRENGVIYGINFTFKVDLLGIDGNGTIKYDLHAEKLPRIATIVNFCTLDSRFLPDCLANVRTFSEQIIISAATHFFDGTPENREELERLAGDLTDEVTEFLILDYDHAQTIRHGSRYWHNFARWSAVKQLTDDIDHVLFLDADEIVEGERFAEWLASGEFTHYDAAALAANWYFREPSYRATSMEEAGLLVRRDAITEELIFDNLERWSFLRLQRCARFLKGCDDLPMLHHYSWVRTKEEMLRKVSAWGHNRDKDWASLVHKEFEHGFTGKDFVHGYNYIFVEPYLSGPASTRYQQATELVRTGKTGEAVQQLENLLESFPDHVPILNQLALLSYQTGDNERALGYFEKSASIAAWEIDTLKNLANLYYEMEDPGNALRIYREIEALNPNDVEVLLSAGNLNYILGQKNSAAAYFSRTLEIDPNNLIARQNIELLGRQHSQAV
jgi:tetratricopeptide (TPR) repeat protein